MVISAAPTVTTNVTATSVESQQQQQQQQAATAQQQVAAAQAAAVAHAQQVGPISKSYSSQALFSTDFRHTSFFVLPKTRVFKKFSSLTEMPDISLLEKDIFLIKFNFM